MDAKERWALSPLARTLFDSLKRARVDEQVAIEMIVNILPEEQVWEIDDDRTVVGED